MPDITEIDQLIESLVELSSELRSSGDWAAANALEEILDETWIRSWRFD